MSPRREKKYSPAEPVTDLRHIPIAESGEPLVDYLEECPLLVRARPRWEYERASFARKSVAEMLCRAAKAMPNGYRIAVVEGWRPPYIQRRLYLSAWNRWKERHPDWSEAQLRRVTNRFTAPLHGRVPPPHSTGGAVDVVLVDDQLREFDLQSPFQATDPRAFPMDAPGILDQAREHRRILADALSVGGLTNYPSEWWHWSFGDQGWAYRTGAPFAIFGQTQPEGWVGHEPDMVDDPLVRLAPRS